MAKLFCVSDVHSFYTPLKKALDEKGFDPNNEEHWLIVCGDAFDRGDESEEVLSFLMPLERKILVKGNHDILLEHCCIHGFARRHDYHNGTAKTIYDLGGTGEGRSFDECCRITKDKLTEYRNCLVNYFETQNYIFVHSWIPVNEIGVNYYEYREDWREAFSTEWEDSMWHNPFFMARDGLNQTGKTIVFGHWHCSFGHMCDSEGELSDFGKDACWDIYHNESQKIFGIDRCTAHTKEVNVLVLEDEFLND